MTGLKWMILLFAAFIFSLTGWIQHVRSKEPVIPWIYYYSQQTGDQELYRMRLDGSSQQRLTFNNGREKYVLISSEWIYFNKYIGTEFDGSNILYRMSPDGSNKEVVLERYSWFVANSPDNSWIYYVIENENGQSLYQMRADGTQQTRLTPLESIVWFQTFDANNEWLYYTQSDKSGWSLYRMYLDGSQQQEIVRISGPNNFHGFSPDKEWLYFTAGSNGGILYRMNLQNREKQQLTPDDYYDSIPYASDFDKRLRISADKTWLYISANTESTTFDVFRMHLDGSQREQLTHLRENAYIRMISPNGAWVYFEMEVNGIRQIFGMRPDGSDIRQITQANRSAVIEAFSSDSEWLYYSTIGYPRDIYRVCLDGTQNQSLTYEMDTDIFSALSLDDEWLYFMSDHDRNSQIYRMRSDGTQRHMLTADAKGGSYWGRFDEPLNLSFHQKKLHTIGFGLLGIFGLFFLVYPPYIRHLSEFAYRH